MSNSILSNLPSLSSRSSRLRSPKVSSNLVVNPFYFNGGDVRISVLDSTSKKDITGLVVAEAMALASPVWKKFLFPPWGKSQTDNSNPAKDGSGEKQKEIDFSHDNADTLLVLLNIAHLLFSKVPNTQLRYQMLYDLAILCDQYDCVALVRPWVDKWLVGATNAVKVKGQEGWLFIAWVFGRETAFKDLAQLLVRRSPTNLTGECLRYTCDFLPEPMPPGIIESILSVRLKTIDRLLEATYSYIDLYHQSNGKSVICKQAKNAKVCDALSYGSAVLGLSKLGLWPRKNAAEIHCTLSELVIKLRAWRIDYLPRLRVDDLPAGVRTGGLELNHRGCGFTNLGDEITAIMNGIDDPVLDCHRVHMKAQKGNV